eukprot:gene34701-44880_t
MTIDEEDNDDEDTEPKKGVASQKRTVLKKPESNHCYGEICHLLALMFDNTEFSWQQLEVSEILNKIDMVSLNPRDESSSAEENESEDENVPNKGQSWSKPSAGVKSKPGTNSRMQKKGLQQRNMNIVTGKELTMKNLALFNLGSNLAGKRTHSAGFHKRALLPEVGKSKSSDHAAKNMQH